MKKIYGFFGAAAILMLAACSKDFDGPKAPESEGDIYMTMTISAQLGTGTRTSTPNQGVEVGKDKENKITDGLLILAEPKTVGDGYEVFASSELASGKIIGNGSNYAASFQMVRADILAAIGDSESKEYYLFVIANYTKAGISKPNKGADVQQILDMADPSAIWSDNNFLMTNAEYAKTTIKKDDVQPGMHTTQATALNLGHVKVQRIMSRFDIAAEVKDTDFTVKYEYEVQVPAEPEQQEGPTTERKTYTTTVKFDAVTLVNMAQKFNRFKEVGTEQGTFGSEWDYFLPETGFVEGTSTSNYVFSPMQTGFTYPLFMDEGETKVVNGKLTGKQVNLETGGGEDNSLKFIYTTLESLVDENNADDPNYTHTGASSEPNYYIWRYCTENTNYDKDNQKNGNSTGIIFRAILSGTPFTEAAGEPVYAYGNVVLGKAAKLRAYVNGNDPGDDVYGFIKAKYDAAVAELKSQEGKDTWTEDGDSFSDIDEYLVANGFTIYKAKDVDSSKVYYTYYIYWNRHNDNSNNGSMGAMEFATVRNNVYKLKVKSVLKLGHPADPNDDPDPNKPDDPDEKEEFWGEVSCEILPWEVRINGIEF